MDTSVLTKYIAPIVKPPALLNVPGQRQLMTMDQFNHVAHSELPAGPVRGYNGSYPGVTIEANRNENALLRFVNNLPTAHLLPIDPTLHGPMGHQMVMVRW